MTQMATKVKLHELPNNPDGSPGVLTFGVTSIVEVEGNYGPQARITGTIGDGEIVSIYEKLDAVTRQLSRIGLSLDSAVDQRLSFWKEDATNGAGQTFKALRIATGLASATATVARVAPKNAKQPISDGAPLPYEETGAPPKANVGTLGTTLDNVATEYQRCIDVAIKVAIATKLDRFTGDVIGAVQAVAATLFIECNKRARG